MGILCFGDSNTYGYDPRNFWGDAYDLPWPVLLAEKTGQQVLNWGENGREIPRGKVEFPENMDHLIIMLGTNDLLQGYPPETVCSKMEQFLSDISLNRKRILLIAPPAMRLGSWVSEQPLVDASVCLASLYRVLAERLGIQFVDAGQWQIPLAYDGVHLTEEGHRIFAEALYSHLLR